jgi:colanic acid biosynthesis glycosyl transferase WcaI
VEKVLNHKAMRILVISQYFWPENFRINDLVSELVKRGHHVNVLTGLPNYPDGKIFQQFRDDPIFYSHYKGAEIIRVPMTPRGKNKVSLMLNYLTFAVSASFFGLWKLRSRQFDVIFTCQLSPVMVGIPAVIIRAIKKIPMVFWILDLWPESLQAIGAVRSKMLLHLIGILVTRIYNRCDLILVQSKSFIPVIAKYAKKSLRVEYFPSWSDLAFNVVNVDAAIEIPAKKNSFTIVFTGNVGEAQDFPAILSAAEKLKNFPHIRWMIVGDGRMAGWVAEEIKVRELGNCVFMLGRFPVERMPSFIKHADALLLTLKDESIFALTIPGKLQSYLAAGKPILAMINGEGARIVNESGSGLTCSASSPQSLADVVLKLSTMSKEKRQDMGRKGLEYSKREFGRSNLISKLELMFDQLLIT